MLTLHLKLDPSVDNDQAAVMAETLGEMTIASSVIRENRDESGHWIVQWYFGESPVMDDIKGRLSVQAAMLGIDLPDMKDLKAEDVPDENWLEKVYQELEPFSVGPFFIYGSHHKDPVPDGRIGLLIDAATAFGSGEHGTTKGCLEAMLDLKAKGICPWNILDMGTGSGILAIAAWKLWHTPILATDIDDESVRVADRYRDLNKVPDGNTGMICAEGDGFALPLVQDKKPYELVIANILAGPLIEMAQDLYDVTDRPGYVILSGMLTDQAVDVRAAYEACGFTFKRDYIHGKWASLVLQKL